MTSYARIEGGLVMELFTTDGDITQLFSPALVWVAIGAPVGAQTPEPGWSYVGGVFAAPVPAVPPIPQQVTMRQARLALNAIGKLASVDAAIAAMADPQKTEAQIEWQYSSAVERNKPLVLQLGPALGLTDADLDNLFFTAAGL